MLRSTAKMSPFCQRTVVLPAVCYGPLANETGASCAKQDHEGGNVARMHQRPCGVAVRVVSVVQQVFIAEGEDASLPL